MVNRTWAQLFGPGFVNPVEDMHDGNTPSHPELLDALAREFGHSGYDLKHLFRAICNSRTYQRTSRPTAGNEKTEEPVFAHQTMKVMTPEQMYDSLARGRGRRQGRRQEVQGREGPDEHAAGPVRELLPGRGRAAQPQPSTRPASRRPCG